MSDTNGLLLLGFVIFSKATLPLWFELLKAERGSSRGRQIHYRPPQRQTVALTEHLARIVAEKRQRDQAVREAAEAKRLAEKARKRDEREAERAAQRLRQDAAYRAMGIAPGPWAWFWALPDVCQAILMGIAISVPAVAILAAIFIILSP